MPFPSAADFNAAGVNQAAFKAALANLLAAVVQQGTGVGQAANLIKIGFDGTRIRVTVDVADFGSFALFDPADGTLTLLADPTADAHAANKLYVDTARNSRLALAGGTLTGPLVLAGPPTAALHPASKAYADAIPAIVYANVAELSYNLSDLPNKATARANLGLGALATASFFESAEQAVVGGATTSVAHGLGGVPKFFSVVLRCKTADLGYAVGDEVTLANNNSSGAGGSGGTSPWANATTLNLSSNSVYTIMKADSSVGANVTMASWKMVLRAWR